MLAIISLSNPVALHLKHVKLRRETGTVTVWMLVHCRYFNGISLNPTLNAAHIHSRVRTALFNYQISPSERRRNLYLKMLALKV